MFTVRLVQSRTTHVSQCAQYVVHKKEGRTILTLYSAEGPVATQVPVATMALEADERAFVMNDNGKTVDSIRGGDR